MTPQRYEGQEEPSALISNSAKGVANKTELIIIFNDNIYKLFIYL